MYGTRDYYGIPFRRVCAKCYERIMTTAGYDGVKYDERDETLGDEVESLHDDEQEKFDNAPEGLEGSERYAAIEAAADNLDTAHDNITEAIEALRAAME